MRHGFWVILLPVGVLLALVASIGWRRRRQEEARLLDLEPRLAPDKLDAISRWIDASEAIGSQGTFEGGHGKIGARGELQYRGEIQKILFADELIIYWKWIAIKAADGRWNKILRALPFKAPLHFCSFAMTSTGRLMVHVSTMNDWVFIYPSGYQYTDQEPALTEAELRPPRSL
jgi:hypothetical protein